MLVNEVTQITAHDWNVGPKPTLALNDSVKRKPLHLNDSYLFSRVKPSYHVSTLDQDFHRRFVFPLIIGFGCC